MTPAFVGQHSPVKPRSPQAELAPQDEWPPPPLKEEEEEEDDVLGAGAGAVGLETTEDAPLGTGEFIGGAGSLRGLKLLGLRIGELWGLLPPLGPG
jgi:hypothetical protein